MKRLIKFLPKLVMLCFVCLLVLALVACGEDNGGSQGNGGNGGQGGNGGNSGQGGEHQWTENELFWDADKNGTPDWQEKEITLTYATWQWVDPEVVTIDTLMLNAFMEKYPNIHVEMMPVGEDYEFETNLITRLAASEEENQLPDVFLINRLENLLPYNMLADIGDFFDHDDDAKYMFDSLKNLGLYEGKRYCLPTFIYPELWIVNKDLLASCNIQAPKYDWTWEQMESIAKAVYEARGTEHKIGIYGTDEYYFELPKVLKMKSDPVAGAKWLAVGFDGTKFNFDDLAFINAMAKMEEGMADGWLVNAIDADTLAAWYGSTDDPRYSGQVAMWHEPAWSFKNVMADLLFDWDVYPGPSGVTGGNTDIAGVSQLCENKAAAYQLLKWMSFDQDGIITRYDLYDKYSTELYMSANNYPYPVSDYGYNGQGENLIWDHIPYAVSAPGYGAVEFPESLRNGAIKANKEIVAWDAGENTFKAENYLGAIIMGEAHYATLYETIQEAAAQAYSLRKQALADAIAGQTN